MFLGPSLPAHQVSRMVLSACAMATGCGQVLRGYTEMAFPYANLASLDVLEEFNGFVAGVTNPRFEELPATWDVLCNVETGKVTVSSRLAQSVSGGPGNGTGKEQAGARSRVESDTSSLSGSLVRIEEDGSGGTPAGSGKVQSLAKADCLDHQFMEDVSRSSTAPCCSGTDVTRFRQPLRRTMASPMSG